MKGINWKFGHRSNLGSILMIVFGAVLVMNPDSASALVSAILGWGLFVVGVMLVIGGSNSSNTRKLYKLCAGICS